MSDNLISNTRPDFEDLVKSLTTALSQKPTWTDLLPYSAGMSLIEFIAAIGTMLNYSIEKSSQETYIDTANLDISVYRAARLLGVSPSRMQSARVVCDLTIQGTANIPAFSQFTIGGDSYYNITAIPNPSPGTGQGTIQGVVLYQGIISKKKFLGTGKAYQTLSIGSNFTVAENFLDVTVSGVPYTRQKEPLWNTSNQNVFQDRTRPEGSAEIVFGNGTFGSIPPLNSQIVVTYAESKGAAGNKANSSLAVTFTSSVQGIISLTGVTKSSVDGSPNSGKDYDSADFVRYTSPRLFAAGKRAVRRDDWRSLALTYPDKKLVDALVWGEHEQRFITTNSFGPMNLNVIRMSVLAETGPLTTQEKASLLAYMEQFKAVSSQLVLVDPLEVRVKLNLKVYVAGNSKFSVVNDDLLAAIRSMFEKKRGSLGKTYHASDINRLLCSNPSVDYCEITESQYSKNGGSTWTPFTNSLVLAPLEYAVLHDPIQLTVQTTQRGD